MTSLAACTRALSGGLVSGLLTAAATLIPAGAGAAPLDSRYITGPVTFSVGDVALLPGLGRQIINPAFGTGSAPNDVRALARNSGFSEASASDLFMASPPGVHPNGSNIDVAGPAAIQFPPTTGAGGDLGIVPGDNISSLSFGHDGSGDLRVILLFSVDPDAQGTADVFAQQSNRQAAGDVFATGMFDPFGAKEAPLVAHQLNNRNSNLQVLDQELAGLEVAANKTLFRPAQDLEDDLDALEVSTFGTGAGVYFTLDQFSPTIVGSRPDCAPIYSAADILLAGGAGACPQIFRPHAALNLGRSDIVDAIALSVGNGDVLFSLDPDSPILAGSGFSAADVFLNSFGNVYASYDSLGLLFSDNLNALDTLRVPEPSGLPLLALAVFMVSRLLRRSRGRRQGIAAAPVFGLVLAAQVLAPASAQVPVPTIGPRDPATQNEPSIVVNADNPAQPNQVIVGFNTAGASTSGYSISNDSGITWPAIQFIGLPAPFRAAGDPALAANISGQAFYAMIAVNTNFGDGLPRGIFVAPQVGNAFGQGVPVAVTADPRVVLDKEFIAIDRVSQAPFLGGARDNIYVTFTRFGPGRNDIQYSRSTNLGRLYSRAVTISETRNAAKASFYRQGSVPAAASGNRVFVTWTEADAGNAKVGRMMFQGSSDGGRSFPIAPALAANTEPHPHRAPVGNGSNLQMVTLPTLAVDNNGGQFDGNIYLAWADRRGGNLDIYFTRSTAAPPAACTFATGPCTVPFAAPVRINGRPAAASPTDQFLPWMAVNDEGTIAVAFVHKRDNVSDDAEVRAVCSFDGGVTWTPDQVLSGLINVDTPGFGGQIRIGEYIGLSSVGTFFHAAWTGDAVPANQDIFTRLFRCMGTPVNVIQPLPTRIIMPDQVTPIRPASRTVLAAFQQTQATPEPEIVAVDLDGPSLVRSFGLPDNPVTDVVLTPDQRRAVGVDASGFNIVDLVAGSHVRIPLTTEFALSEISVTPDSRKALVAFSTPLGGGQGAPLTSKQEVAIFDLAAATRVTVALPTIPLSGITITPDSRKALLAIGGAVAIIDVAAGSLGLVALPDLPDTGIALTPDGSRALVAAGPNVYLIDIASATAIPVAVPNRSLTDIVVTPDGARAVLASEAAVSIVDIAAATATHVALASPPLTGADVTPDSSLAVIRNAQGAHLIALATGSDLVVPLTPAVTVYVNPVITPDGRRAVLGDDRNVHVIDLAAPLAPLSVPIGEAPIVSIAVTPGSDAAVFATPLRFVHVALASGLVRSFPLQGGGARTGTSISPDGWRAVVLSDTGVEVLRLDTLTSGFVSRGPRTPMVNTLFDDGQGPLPPFAERGRRSVLDGR